MGSTPLDLAGVQALATLPSLDELRAKIVGLIVAPATKRGTGTPTSGGPVSSSVWSLNGADQLPARSRS